MKMRKQHMRTALAATLLVLGCEQVTAETSTVTPPVTSQSAPQPAIKTAPPAAASVPDFQDFQNQVLLTVNGKPITGGMLGAYLAERMQKMPQIKPSPQLQNMILNELINIMLLAQVAHETDLDNQPGVAMALNLQRDQLLSRMVLQERASASTPSDESLKKAYDAEYATPVNEYKAAHILVKTEDEAKKIIEQLGKGTDFAVLAKEHSEDSNKNKGGDLGWFEASQMVQPFSTAVADMKIGTVSTKPVQTQFGWHVIKLEDRRVNTPPTFEAVRSRLLADAQRKTLGDYIEQLRGHANIEVVKPANQSAPTATAEPAIKPVEKPAPVVATEPAIKPIEKPAPVVTAEPANQSVEKAAPAVTK